MKRKLLSSIGWLKKNSILNRIFRLIRSILRSTFSLKNLNSKTRVCFTVSSAFSIGKNMRSKMFYSFISKMKTLLNFWLTNKEDKSLKYKLFS